MSAAPLLNTIKLRTRVDCVRHLVSTSDLAGLAMLFGCSAVFFWLLGRVASPWMFGWYGAMLLLLLLRLAFRLVFERKFRVERVAHWEWAYAALMGTIGLGWGSLAWIPVAVGRPGLENVMIFCVTVILLVSSSTLVASKRVFLVFVAAVLIPLVAAEMMLTGFSFLLGAGGLAIGVVLSLAYSIHHRILITALESRHGAQDLLQQLRVVFESAGEGIVFIKPKPEYTSECNRRFADMLGYPLADMQGMEPWLWHPDREQWKTMVADAAAVISQGRAFHQVIRLMRADGSLFWADTTGMAVDAGNLSAGTVWVISDITDKRATEAALRLSEQRFRDLVKISSDLYWEQDADFRFTKFDGKDEVLTQLPLANYLGRAPWEVEPALRLSGLEWEDYRALLEARQAFRDLIYSLEMPDGQTRWLTVSGNPLFDDAGRFIGYHGVSSDITGRVLTEERYRHLAFHDPLTQLPNRRLFDDRLEQAIRSAARRRQLLALLLVDLDGFKQVNDSAGHAAGDAVLKAVAERLRQSVREYDTVARLGGDEFVVLLKEVSGVDVAVQVAEKILSSLDQPMSFAGTQFRIGASIGIALYPKHGVSGPELLAQSDAAMYRGKHEGGHGIHVYSELA